MLSIVTALILLSNRTTDTAALLARTGAVIPEDQLNIKPAIIAVITSIRRDPVVGIKPRGACLDKVSSLSRFVIRVWSFLAVVVGMNMHRGGEKKMKKIVNLMPCEDLQDLRIAVIM